eukprot:scaffold3189_cov166-Amphora_coffeaeformis.AAC.12
MDERSKNRSSPVNVVDLGDADDDHLVSLLGGTTTLKKRSITPPLQHIFLFGGFPLLLHD